MFSTAVTVRVLSVVFVCVRVFYSFSVAVFRGDDGENEFQENAQDSLCLHKIDRLHFTRFTF